MSYRMVRAAYLFACLLLISLLSAPYFGAPISADTEAILAKPGFVNIFGSGLSSKDVAIFGGQTVTWQNRSNMTLELRYDDPNLTNKVYLPIQSRSSGQSSSSFLPATNQQRNRVILSPNESFSVTYPLSGEFLFRIIGLDGFHGVVTVFDQSEAPLKFVELHDQTVELGQTLRFNLAAATTANTPPTFDVQMRPLPENAAFDVQRAEFTFRPDETQVGTQEITFTATEGSTTVAQTVSIIVPELDPNASTQFRGRLLDANDAAQGIQTPLSEATITHIESGTSVQTSERGYFIFEDVAPGNQHFEYNGATVAPANSYGAYRSEVYLIENAANEIDRPIYIMAIDSAGQTTVNPNGTTVVNNPNIDVTITIPPRTVRDDDGNLYDGPISVSEVPDEFTPSSLPGRLDPSMVVTIQPMGLTFDRPAPVTFPNVDDLTPGSEVNFWSMDHETSQFFVAGTGIVSEDGATIETDEGGIRESSWHFPLPQSPRAGTKTNDKDPENKNLTCNVPMSSSLSVYNGCLKTNIELPSYASLGSSRNVELVYNSERAFPQTLLPLNMTIDRAAAVPDLLSVDLSVGGVDEGRPIFVDASSLSESEDETVRVTLPVDTADYETGVYSYSAQYTSHYSDAAVSSANNDRLYVVNHIDSPFGAGWSVAGLSTIQQNADGSILYVNGDGSVDIFNPAPFDFNEWQQQGPLDNGSWSISEDGTSIFQAINGNPTFFVSNERYTNTTIRGQFSVGAAGNDITGDFMGFVFGYQAPVENNGDAPNQFEFILFDWKQGNQDLEGVDGNIYVGQEGFTLGRVNGTFGTDPENTETGYYPETFWEHTPTARYEPLATDYGEGRGWLRNTEYRFTLIYNSNRIQIFIEDELIFDEFGSFPNGRFGFYNYSQANVTYSSFTSSAETERFVGPDGDYSELTLDTSGRFTRRYKNGMIERFDTNGRLIAVRDRNGNTTRYGYNGVGLLSAITDPVGQVTTFTYQGGHLFRITDPVGRDTIFIHDAQGNLTSVTLPDGSQRGYGYDDRHLMTSETDENNQTTTRQYDEFGRLIEAALADGTVRETVNSQQVGLINFAESVGTEANPAPVVRDEEAVSSLTDGEGRTTQFKPGPLTLPSEVTDAAGFVTTVERDENGNPTRTLLPSGAAFNRTFDEQGNMLTFEDETVNGTTTFTYELAYNLVASITDPFGDTTTFGYDGQGNLINISTPLNRTVTFGYNDQGLVTDMVDTLGTPTTYGYDANGNLISLTQGAGAAARAAEMGYTAEGYLSTLTDPLGRQFTFIYDDLGRLVEEQLPGNRIIEYGYDDVGNLISLTPPGQPAHTFDYSEINLMTSYNAPPVAGGGSNQTSYSYNNAQQLTEIVRPDGLTLDYAYDPFGRLSTVTIPEGAYTYAYSDATGQLESMTAPDGSSLGYSYDGELITQVNWSGDVAGSVGYGYDAAARLNQIDIAGVPTSFAYDEDGMLTQAGSLTLTYDPVTGLPDGSSQESVTNSWGFNQFAELESYSAAFAGSDIFALDYSRDDLGRITQKVETVGVTVTTTDYTYDAAGRLFEVRENGQLVATYTYDLNGNRLNDGTSDGTYDDQDRLLTYGAASYTYTPNGELLTKTEGGDTTSYDYDVLGNLRDVTLPNGTAIEYLIDAADRRVGKRVNGTLVQGFLYGDDLNPVAELDGSGNVVSRFIYASQAHVPDFMVQNGITYRIISDHLGSVRLVVNASTGDIVQQLDYDAWGVVTQDSNPGFQPFGFAGGLYDADTGLVRFGARDYNAEIGRWTAKDPIRFASGASNFYEYVTNNPISNLDIFGQSAISETKWRHISRALPIAGAFAVADSPFVPIGDAVGVLLICGALVSDVADLLDRKVSPQAQSMMPPGNCGESEHRRLQNEVNNSCKGENRPRSCSPQGLDETDYLSRANNFEQCALARNKINNICFAGGDKAHRNKEIEAWNGFNACMSKLSN